jgi:hypothetical protein
MMSDLSKLQWEFSQAIADLMQQAEKLGYHVAVGEFFRSPEQATWNAAHGTGIANSNHCNKLAADLNLFTASGAFITDDTGHRDLGAYWKAKGPLYCWGGDFQRRDYNHYSIKFGGVE